MLATTTGKKLDLSKLSDEEAKHVWKVVQRDFNLRKKEEDRLGDLKTKLEKEDTKTELLGNQSSLTHSHCIRCLQPFKFLLISKHQCVDCQLHICKLCSRFSKTERGWVCNACHMARVLKIGTLEWYYENVRARFKRFGSAKVMRSLFKRLSGENRCSQSSLRDRYEEHGLDATDAQPCKEMKKTKRRLTVDPFDFNLDSNYSSKSRGQSNQDPSVHDLLAMNLCTRESQFTDEEMVTVFHQVLEEQHKAMDQEKTFQQGEQDDLCSEHRPIPSPSTSRLSFSSYGSGSVGGLRGGCRLLPGESEEEDEPFQPYLQYQSHTSQESLYSENPAGQITDLNRRMSVIETLLNRIEQKVTSTYEQAPLTPSSSSPPPQLEDVDLEEQQLRQKLHQMTDNISDHSSDEEESTQPNSPPEVLAWRSPLWDLKSSRIPICASRSSIVSSGLGDELPEQNDSQKTNYSFPNLEWKGHLTEDSGKTNFKGSTALLVELEDKVAQTAVKVQNAESQVLYIEDRIAALNASVITVDETRMKAGMTRTPEETSNVTVDSPTLEH